MQPFKLHVRCSVEIPGKVFLALIPIIVAMVIEVLKSVVHH